MALAGSRDSRRTRPTEFDAEHSLEHLTLPEPDGSHRHALLIHREIRTSGLHWQLQRSSNLLDWETFDPITIESSLLPGSTVESVLLVSPMTRRDLGDDFWRLVVTPSE